MIRRVAGPFFWLSLWALVAAAQMQQLPPVAPGTGSIEGIVIDSATHEPVRKVQVTLGGAAGVALYAVTDAGGRFAFRQLPPGTFWLSASNLEYSRWATVNTAANISTTLGEDEHKQGITITITRGGSISGRVTNEDGRSVRGCSVSTLRPGLANGRRRLIQTGEASTDDRGEYRIREAPPGHQYVFVHCRNLLPAAHPLLPPGDPRTPHETYQPKFYGGSMDPSSAARLTIADGVALDGIDFQLTRVPAFTVRGSVTSSDPEALADGASLQLVPANDTTRGLLETGAYADAQKRTFEISPVIAGAYVLYAFSTHDGRTFAGEQAVEVGTAQPDPLEIRLTAGIELKGSVQLDSGDHLPEDGGQVMLLPVDKPLFGPQPTGNIGKDGAFTLAGVTPGRFRLNVTSPNYVKSVSLGGQPVTPDGFDIGPATIGPLVIVLASKMASLTVHIAGPRPEGQVWVLAYPEDPERLSAGTAQVGIAQNADQVQFGGLPPGRYRVFATDLGNPSLLEQTDQLHALASHAAMIEVPEAGQASITVDIMPRDELLRTIEAQE